MLIPPLNPPPLCCEHLRQIVSATFWDYWGCLVRYETDFVNFWVKLDIKKNNTKRRTAQIFNLKVRGSILMVKLIRKYMKYRVRSEHKICFGAS